MTAVGRMADLPAPSILTVAALTAGVAITVAAANRAAARTFDCLISGLLSLSTHVFVWNPVGWPVPMPGASNLSFTTIRRKFRFKNRKVLENIFGVL
jgi:hypothetical protein